jgi:S-methylmethionine-dependent homocysteine/selenocysteine methylase
MQILTEEGQYNPSKLEAIRQRYFAAKEKAQSCGFKDICPEYHEQKLLSNPATISGYDKRLGNYESKLKAAYEAFTGDYKSKQDKFKFYAPDIETIDHRGVDLLTLRELLKESL